MTVDELRTLLLALPGDLELYVQADDPSQGVAIFGDLQTIGYDCGSVRGLVLKTTVLPTVRPPANDPEFLKDPFTELDSPKHLRLLPPPQAPEGEA